MQRRDFLKGACRICLLGAVGGAAVNLTGCSPSVGNSITRPEVVDNKVSVPLTAFDKNPLQVISPGKYPYEIAVEKRQDGTYKALLMKCTHYENEVVSTGNGFTCSAHGSRFDKEGKVLKGPAAQPLTQLRTTVTGTEIFIHL